ncbi:lytic transglycosylase domain-containing protein [Kribbella sp. NPDC058245]|uniref:lytic transglycosylase domain-containing protein n=1 Tax=Kribbella sp. NPDC058245 TaxID=3346399 RepID=UPI0036EB5E2D
MISRGDTWRVKLIAGWACAAPLGVIALVVASGGSGTPNQLVVDSTALTGFIDRPADLPPGPGVDGRLPVPHQPENVVPETGSTDGTVQPIPGLAGDASGIPGTVLAAYQRVAQDLSVATPGCHLTWPLLAGVGKVESDHANAGKVDAQGNTRGRILGPVLDGGPGMAAIADTDQGQYDGNAQWDRAVGPMQFIPGTWKTFGADGNGDGIKNPHNVYDAARAAGNYLCWGGANLGDPQGLVQSVLRYNHSMDYVSTVLRWMQSYSRQTVQVPDGQGVITPPTDDNGNVDITNDPTRPTPVLPTPSKPIITPPVVVRPPVQTPQPPKQTPKPPYQPPTKPGTPPATPTPTPTPQPTPTPTPTPDPTPTPTPTPTPDPETPTETPAA